MMKVLGADFSRWQDGIDFAKVKAEGYQFLILRAMYHTTIDKCFEKFYAEAKKQGFGVGAYLYSTAKSEAQAIEEANALIKVIAGKQFEYPIYFDIEDKAQAGLGKDKNDAIVTAFCTTIEKAGYFAGFYCNTNWYMNQMNGEKLAKRFTHWRAQWSKSETTAFPMWQFGGEQCPLDEITIEKFNRELNRNERVTTSRPIAGKTIDKNYCFVDFPAKIKGLGLNGFSKSQSSVVETPASAPVTPPKAVKDNYAGKTARVKSGAVYGGLSGDRGKQVPSFVISKPYIIDKSATHNGVLEALLRGLNSWVAVSSLAFGNEPTVITDKITRNSKVRVGAGATWYDGKGIDSWVFKTTMTVRSNEFPDGSFKISITDDGGITGRINKKFLTRA